MMSGRCCWWWCHSFDRFVRSNHALTSTSTSTHAHYTPQSTTTILSSLRTQHPAEGFACLSQKAHGGSTVWLARHTPQVGGY